MQDFGCSTHIGFWSNFKFSQSVVGKLCLLHVLDVIGTDILCGIYIRPVTSALILKQNHPKQGENFKFMAFISHCNEGLQMGTYTIAHKSISTKAL